jgi:hypothetical protein
MSRTWDTRKFLKAVHWEDVHHSQKVGGTETKSREARNDRETDQSVVLRDGRAVHTGKGLTEIRSL